MSSTTRLAEEGLLKELDNLEKRSASYEAQADFVAAARSLEKAAGMMSDNHVWEDAARLYASAGGRFEVGECWSEAATLYHYSGDLYHRLNRMDLARSHYDDAAFLYLKCGEPLQAIECYQKAAEASSAKRELKLAGQYLASAGDLLLQLGPSRIADALERYLESALEYANSGSEEDSRKSYDSFTQGIDDKIYDSRGFEFVVNKLMKTLEENGFDGLAGRVYLDKMRRKRRKKFCVVKESWSDRRIKDVFRHGVSWSGSWLFDKTSHYGESGFRWVFCTLAYVVFFAVLYFPSPNGHGYLQLRMTDGFRYPVMEHVFENFVRSLSFSVTVFSTLGFGDVSPANTLAEIVVIFDVLGGYVFLGVLVALITRRLVINRIYR